jgi:[protein-PII] uridylyltransferase
MNPLIAKIEESARKQLVLPPLSKPADELPRYKRFLKVESHRLQILHRGGAGGLEVCRARSAMMDVLIRHLWSSIQSVFPAPKGKAPKIALVAFGGYGRGELNPFSDIDLMFLHAEGLSPEGPELKTLADWTSGLLYTLWDIGLKVGHAVRTVGDCVRLANEDMQAKTSLIEARLVTGDGALFEQLQREVEKKCVRRHEDEYIAQRLADQASRRAKHGNSPALQEPNVKNGVGGLRDFQNLLWMAYFKHGTRSLMDLQKAEFLSAAERKQMEAAYDFLLRTRNELHYVAGRAAETLTPTVKPAVAHGLGFTDRSPRARTETFMREYYTHARNLYLTTRTLEQRLALVPSPGASKSGKAKTGKNKRGTSTPAEEFDGFTIVDGQLHMVDRNILKQDRGRILRAFLEAQKRGLQIHPDLAQLLRQQVSLVDRSFKANSHYQATFLEILNQRGNVAPYVRAMHEVGLLGRFLPEFDKMTNLVQHEFYHQYAVDEHTLTCVAKLDQVWGAETRPFSGYTELFRRVERPFVLYLALLLHDCGKAFPGRRHEIVGAELALKVAKRFRLDGTTAHTLSLIIEHHLTMVQTSQRRDLDDPEVIRTFAAQVQGIENLDLLTLHTFADSMGTSDTLWNSFKDSLLLTLHKRATLALQGTTEFIEAEMRQRQLLRDQVQALLPKTFSEEEISAHFDGLPARYFQIHSPRQMARDLTLVHQFIHLQLTQEDRALEPAVLWNEDKDRGWTRVHFCTWDRPGLFTKFTGALTAAGLNIFSAQIFTRADGVVLDSFYVTDARTGAAPDPAVRERFEKLIRDVLAKGTDIRPAVRKIAAQTRPLYQALAGERLEPEIRFDTSPQNGATIIDLETEDRVGLLFALSQSFSELGLNLVLAKIVTEKGAAIDTFYVTEKDGAPVLSRERRDQIASELRRVIRDL